MKTKMNINNSIATKQIKSDYLCSKIVIRNDCFYFEEPFVPKKYNMFFDNNLPILHSHVMILLKYFMYPQGFNPEKSNTVNIFKKKKNWLFAHLL